jgi:hypothetical protein
VATHREKVVGYALRRALPQAAGLSLHGQALDLY